MHYSDVHLTTVYTLIFIGIIILSLIFFKNKRKEIWLIIVSCVFALIIGETFLRIFLPQIAEHNKLFEYDEILGWKFVPNKKAEIIYPGEIRNTVKINSQGFRDHAPSAEKKNKLMVVGDSFVSNISVKDNEVFTEIMEVELKNCDVLNFGVNGYGQVQEYLLLQKWIDKIKPDAIILMIYLQNDLTDNTGNYWLYERPSASFGGEDSLLEIKSQSKIRPLQNTQKSPNIFSNSHLYRLISSTVKKRGLFTETDSLYTPPEYYSCRWPVSEDYNSMYRIMEALLLKIVSLGKEKDIPVVFVLAPSIIQIEDEVWKLFLEKYVEIEKNYNRSLPNEILMHVAHKNNLYMIDLFPMLKEESQKQVKLYHTYEQHWTKEGNRIVADCIINYLKSHSLIDH